MLRYGKYKYNNFRGISESYFTIEIWKKDYEDTESNGDKTLYPPIEQARDFEFLTTYNSYWKGLTNPDVPGWSWASDHGGSAYHTNTANTDLIYTFDTNLLVSGQQYMVEIELAGVTAGSLSVKLGTAQTAQFNSDGTHTEIITANGGQLALDPLTAFIGYVKLIKLYKYFPPAEEFNTSGEGFEITWNGQGGTRNRTFVASECKVNYIVENTANENFVYSLVSGGAKEYFVRIYRSIYAWDTEQGTANSEIFWYGYLMPSFDAIENGPFPYLFSLTANDSYGLFSKIEPKTFANEDAKQYRYSIKSLLRTIFTEMSLGYIEVPGQFNLTTNVDWWQSTDTYGSFNPATKYHAARGFVTKPTTYTETGEIEVNNKPYEYKPIEVFDGVMKAMNLVGFLSQGSYVFLQPNSLINNATGEVDFYRYFGAGAFNDPAGKQTVSLLEEVKSESTGSYYR